MQDQTRRAQRGAAIAETYDSHPGPTARRLGAFLTTLCYQCDVIICAMFLTGQASNAIIAGFAKQTTGIDLTYQLWLTAGLLPGLSAASSLPMAASLDYTMGLRSSAKGSA